MVNNWPIFIRSWLYPASCQLCLAAADSDINLCRECREELPWCSTACSRCALPTADGANISTCIKCQNNPPALDHCSTLFSYQAPVDHWIQQLKFHQNLAIAQLLGQFLAVKLQGQKNNFEILPVPLHSQRLRQRGYNQSLEIARPLLAGGFRLSGIAVKRTRATSAQSDLPASSRWANVRGAFQVSERIFDKNILLIDDVMTTGATLNELAHTLKQAGANQVHAWVIARTAAR